MLGQQLEDRTRQAMAAAKVRSVSELARRSHVQRDTLYAWWHGDRIPKPDTLGKVADVLDVPLGTLWDYVEDAAPGDLAAAITALVAELRAWREEDRPRLDQLETTVARLAAGRLSGPGTAEPAAPRARQTRAG